MEKLSVKGLAIGLGLSWSICILFSGLASMFGWCAKFVEVTSSVYVGFKPTFLGSILGAAWGFIDGAIGGAIIAAVYNAVIKKKK